MQRAFFFCSTLKKSQLPQQQWLTNSEQALKNKPTNSTQRNTAAASSLPGLWPIAPQLCSAAGSCPENPGATQVWRRETTARWEKAHQLGPQIALHSDTAARAQPSNSVVEREPRSSSTHSERKAWTPQDESNSKAPAAVRSWDVPR